MATQLELPVYFPSPHLSTDNAAMIAAAGTAKLLAGERAGLDLNADVTLKAAKYRTGRGGGETRQGPGISSKTLNRPLLSTAFLLTLAVVSARETGVGLSTLYRAHRSDGTLLISLNGGNVSFLDFA